MHNSNRLQLERIDTGGGVERKRSVINCKMPRIPAGHMRIMVNPRPFLLRERGVAGETTSWYGCMTANVDQSIELSNLIELPTNITFSTGQRK